MIKNLSPCIVIPIYKDFDNLDDSEIISLNQNLTILGNYPIIFIGPVTINWSKYLIICSAKKVSNVEVKIFDKYFFLGIQGYNNLLVNYKFYSSFKKYTHILISQLDAYVFRDELLYWCKHDFDYIGAPWFEDFHNASADANFIGVGNGGFSLRKVSSFIKVLKKIRTLSFLIKFHRKFKLKKLVSKTAFLRLFRYNENAFKVSEFGNINEDFFWGMMIPKTFRFYNTAPYEDALRFSFEVNPKYLFELNNRQLPFGCHAWSKYDKSFFEPYIKKSLQ